MTIFAQCPRVLPLVGLILAGCSLEPREKAEVRIRLNLPQSERGADQIVASASSVSRDRAANLPTDSKTFLSPPTSTSGFDCFAVNVMGPGIDSIEPIEAFPPALLPGLYGGSHCSYPGVVSSFIPNSSSTGTDVTLSVPIGPGRIIQVWGIKSQGEADTSSPNTCPANFLMNSEIEAYEIGRVVKDIFSATSIEISNNYPSSANANWLQRHVACNPPIRLTCGSGSTTRSLQAELDSVSDNIALKVTNIRITGGLPDGVTGTVSWTGCGNTYLTNHPSGSANTQCYSSSGLTLSTAVATTMILRGFLDYEIPEFFASGTGSGKSVTGSKPFITTCAGP